MLGTLLEQLDAYFLKKNLISSNFLYLLALFFIVCGLLIQPLPELLQGYWEILIAPSNLVTDYFAVGGYGATFVNAGLLMLLNAFMVSRHAKWMTGPLFAALFTVTGFAFFGKNLFNTIPFMLGAWLYTRFLSIPSKKVLLTALFSTALSPVVSLVSFGQGLPLIWGISLGYALGIFIGFVVSPIASSFLRFHLGFNLYNLGFTSGVLAMVVASVMRSFKLEVEVENIQMTANYWPVFAFVILLCLFLILMGWSANRFTFKGYRALNREAGTSVTDFVLLHGSALTLVNIGILGLLALAYLIALDGVLNGPVMGGILTVMGFAAFGKHPSNVAPVVLGIFLMQYFMLTHDPDMTSAILAALFGTTLAPIAGHYGPLAGFLAGALHASLVNNVGGVHAGLNLYNNGFSGGFVAATMAPVLETIAEWRRDRAERSRISEG